MPVKIIVAFDENRVIGKGNKIPWRIPADMEHFKTQTTGCPVIMGRKTWDSLPKKFKPLPDRVNIVISRNFNLAEEPQPHVLAGGLGIAIESAKMHGNTVWIIGGSEIYRQSLDLGLVDEVIATEVNGKHDGDVFFPELDPTYWQPHTLSHHDGFRIVRWKQITPQDYNAQ